MRRFAVLVFLSCPIVWSSRPVAAAELQIDHVTVAGSNINALLKAFTAATNLPTEYGGKHLNHATEMALASFPDGSYLEFMGIQDQAEPVAVATHVWSKFLKTDAGPCAFALRSRDLSAEVTQLKSAGISVKEPERSGRTRPDGMRLEWKTTDIGAGTRGGLFPFLIEDVTPRANRVYLTGKPTTDRFNGISKVVIGVSDLNAAIAKYQRAFKLGSPRLQRDTDFGAQLAWFENTPIILAQGLDKGSWLTRRVDQYGDSPCAFILAARGGLVGTSGSAWFGRTIFWEDEQKLGWRLGLEASR